MASCNARLGIYTKRQVRQIAAPELNWNKYNKDEGRHTDGDIFVSYVQSSTQLEVPSV